MDGVDGVDMTNVAKFHGRQHLAVREAELGGKEPGRHPHCDLAMSYRVLPCLTVSYRVLPCLTVSYHVLPPTQERDLEYHHSSLTNRKNADGQLAAATAPTASSKDKQRPPLVKHPPLVQV